MGLIHRDISPENIMLSQDHHGKLLVKVIDFGIAKQLAEGEGGQGLTQTGMFLGKLKYASPEQAGFLKEGERVCGAETAHDGTDAADARRSSCLSSYWRHGC